MLEGWFTESGGEGLVFEREDEPGRHLTSGYVTKSVLYPALGVDRVGERGRERNLHSFARIALERGAEITWVRRQLGHSNIQLTVNTYGEWSRAAQKAQAERLAGALPV